MTQLLDRPPGTSPPNRSHGARKEPSCRTGPPYLSTRQLIVAVMTADGSTCRDIALELSLPLRTAQGHLHGALQILDLARPEDLTHEHIAAHGAPPVPAIVPQSERAMSLVLELAVTRMELERQRTIEKQLMCALRTRDSIGQAKGILMERYKIGADAAFGMLERESGRSNRKLVDVAECLLYTGGTDSAQVEVG